MKTMSIEQFAKDLMDIHSVGEIVEVLDIYLKEEKKKAISTDINYINAGISAVNELRKF